MQNNRFMAETSVMRGRPYYGVAVKKAPPKKTGYAVHNGIDDFLRSCPVFSLNEFGEKVIRGRRIC
jgi:hypothetical protein